MLRKKTMARPQFKPRPAIRGAHALWKAVSSSLAQRGAGVSFPRRQLGHTPTPHGRLMSTVLGGLAEFERELVRLRTGEGRTRAKARGVHMGRPPKLTPAQRREGLQALARGEPTQADLVRRFLSLRPTMSVTAMNNFALANWLISQLLSLQCPSTSPINCSNAFRSNTESPRATHSEIFGTRLSRVARTR